MSLNSEDREWVGAIIKLAASETLNAGRDFSRTMTEGHAKDCPNFKKWKWVFIGVGIGLGVSDPQWIKGLVTVFCM